MLLVAWVRIGRVHLVRIRIVLIPKVLGEVRVRLVDTRHICILELVRIGLNTVRKRDLLVYKSIHRRIVLLLHHIHKHLRLVLLCGGFIALCHLWERAMLKLLIYWLTEIWCTTHRIVTLITKVLLIILHKRLIERLWSLARVKVLLEAISTLFEFLRAKAST